MSTKSDVTIVVLSCDKYSDLWEPFFYCFHKQWSTCPYPVRLGSNTISSKDKNIQTILSGPDTDWSSSLRAILKQIPTQYVFIWLDDIFPISPISTHHFSEVLAFMKKNDGKHLHIEPSPKPDMITSDGRYGIYEKGVPYRCTALGFWNVSYLYNLLIPGESPWNFEIMGSYRSAYADGFYCTMEPLFSTLHVIEKGRIFSEAYDYCQTHKIPLSTVKRPVLAHTFYLKSEIQKYYFNAIKHIPWKIRVSLMNILRKLLISY